MCYSYLRYPVYTLEKQLLLPEGAHLSPETMNILISRSSFKFRGVSNFLSHASVKKDILGIISEVPAYRDIFADSQKMETVMNLMGAVQVPNPILEGFEYFKYRDVCTYRHNLMVFALSTLLAYDVIKDKKRLIRQLRAALVHDFGKICVPLEILNKSEPLTQSELQIMRHHTISGYVLLSYYMGNGDDIAVRAARDHHERKNGAGYPRGAFLADKMIEIIVVSDVYDALISSRPYRSIPYDNRSALEEIIGMAFRGEMDWGVVKALVANNRREKPHYSKCNISVKRRGTSPKQSSYGVVAKPAKPEQRHCALDFPKWKFFQALPN